MILQSFKNKSTNTLEAIKQNSKNKNKMSEQIQSLLNEMEDKFQRSFSQTNLEDPANKQLNPQSAKKTELKEGNIQKLSGSQHADFDQVKELLTSQLNRDDEQNEQEDRDDTKAKYQQHSSGERINPHSQDPRGPNLSQFKLGEQIPEQDIEDLRKVMSQQQFQKVTNDTVHPAGKDNPFYYKQLTMKLQKALQKISSDKTVGQLNKSHSFYDRIEQFQNKKKRQIQRRKQELQEKQISSVKDRPLINSHSRAIVQQISNDPIYVRCDKIIQKKKERLLQYERIKEERSLKEYEQFKEEFDAHMDELKQKYKGKTIRSPQEYYKEMMTWIKHKERNIESKAEQQKEKLKSQNTFKPLINSKSQKILLSKKQQKRVPIFDRQPKIKETATDPNCTFKPKINKTTFHKKVSYYQSPF